MEDNQTTDVFDKWFLIEHKEKGCGCAFTINLKRFLSIEDRLGKFLNEDKPEQKPRRDLPFSCPSCGADIPIEPFNAYHTFIERLGKDAPKFTIREIHKPINSETIEF